MVKPNQIPIPGPEPGKNRAQKGNPPGKSSSARNASGARSPVPGTEINGNGKVRYKSLVINGTKYRTRLNRKFKRRRSYRNPDPRKISSTIPGTVIRVYVDVGQEVKEGDQMLVLEAMKMKNRMLFHTGGTVKAIHVKEGEKIPKDFLMLELA